jgi:soluble lytic murein transglycosylase-like protein
MRGTKFSQDGWFRLVYLILSSIVLVGLIAGTVCEKKAEPKPEVVTPATPTESIVPDVIPPEPEEAPSEPSPVREGSPLDEETQLLLYQACGETGIPYELALAVVWQETDFRNVGGDNGASAGYMQIQRQWHEERMERLGVTNLMDPYSNFLVGCDYLAELTKKERGLEWALHAYNGGPAYANAMAKAEKVSQYTKDVINYMNELRVEEF